MALLCRFLESAGTEIVWHNSLARNFAMDARVVYDGFCEESERICNLIIDNYDGGCQAGAYLKNMDHRRILCISDNDVCVDKERMEGCRAGAENCDVDWLQIPTRRQERFAFYTENLSMLMRYTAVFAMSDVYAVELMGFLQKQRISIPEDISVIGFDNTGLSEKCYPRLTTVGQDAGMRARMAVKALRELRAGTCETTVYRLPVQLIVRESVKKR